MNEAPRWDQSGYWRIVNVSWQPPTLLVTFEDSTVAAVDAEQLLAPEDGPVDWARLTWSPYELAAPSPYEIVVVPAERVRVLTDPEYAAHLASAAENEARTLGERMRALREARGFSAATLAADAGMSREQLARIERGDPPVTFADLAPLLAALGCSTADLLTAPSLTKLARRTGHRGS